MKQCNKCEGTGSYYPTLKPGEALVTTWAITCEECKGKGIWYTKLSEDKWL